MDSRAFLPPLTSIFVGREAELDWRRHRLPYFCRTKRQRTVLSVPFAVNHRNKNSRRAYYRAACQFSEWHPEILLPTIAEMAIVRKARSGPSGSE